MIEVTLTQTDNGSAVATPTGNIVYGTDFFDKRLNQFELLTVDGTDVVYDNGPNIVIAIMIMKGVSYADGLEFKSWVRSSIKYAYNRFTLSAITGLNLGKGKGVAITEARYNGGQSDDGVFEYVAPDNYNVRFPYRFIR